MSKEEWEDVVGYEGVYQVSDYGRVRRAAPGPGTWPGRVLKPGRAGRGYLTVDLSLDGRIERMYVHRLVAEAFFGPAPSPKHEVNHKNGVIDDNRVENLEWVTPSENQLHACRILGRKNPGFRGEAHSQVKLTRRQVRSIRRLYETHKYTKAELGRMFGVTQENIGHIVRRKTWRHV
jgi:hypothetical protein